MRVLHVSEVSWGGVVSLLQKFAEEQVRRGHRVSMLVPAAFPKVVGVEHYRWDLQRSHPGSYLPALARLRGVVRATRPDVVHLHSSVAGIFGRLPVVSGLTDVPVVYQPHAWSFDLFDNVLIGAALRRWERAASARTEVLVGNCGDEIAEGERIGVLTPGYALGVPLDTEHFHPVSDEIRAGLREEMGVREEGVVLCLGRLAKQKGQDQLVAAWESTPIPGTELILAGPGDPGPLQQLAPTQWGRSIRWVGEEADVRPWLWACDVLALPSRYETVAVVVVEAMSCGRPVVATGVNGAEMAVTDPPLDPAGAVVGAGDMTALLAECQRRLADPQLCKKEALAGRERARTLFQPTTVVDRLDAAYAHALRA